MYGGIDRRSDARSARSKTREVQKPGISHSVLEIEIRGPQNQGGANQVKINVPSRFDGVSMINIKNKK